MEQYGYLLGNLILGIPWTIFFFLRKDLRKEMLWAGIIGMFLGFTNFLYVPEYWNPPTLFNLLDKIGFSIEDALNGIFNGGIAAVIFEFIERKKTQKIHTRRYPSYIALAIFFISYFGLELLFPQRTIYHLSSALLLTALVSWNYRPDLGRQIITSGVLFGLLYWSLFFFFNQIFPTFVSSFYTLKNMSGIYLLSVPFEEVLFGFSLGAGWSVLYEFTKGYRTISKETKHPPH